MPEPTEDEQDMLHMAESYRDALAHEVDMSNDELVDVEFTSGRDAIRLAMFTDPDSGSSTCVDFVIDTVDSTDSSRFRIVSSDGDETDEEDEGGEMSQIDDFEELVVEVGSIVQLFY